jgi:hypothetical protein
LKKLADDPKVGIATTNGYALIARTQQIADKAAKSTQHLADNKTYEDQTHGTNDDGVASGWLNLTKVSALAKDEVAKDPTAAMAASGFDKIKGYMVFDASLEDGALKVTGDAHGLSKTTKFTPAKTTTSIAGLPNDTSFAVQVDGLGEGITRQWPQFSSQQGFDQIDGVASFIGIHLPGDLANVVGNRLILAGHNFNSNVPEFGALTATDKPAAAKQTLDTLLNFIASTDGSTPPVAVTQTKTGIAFGSSKGYTAKLAAGGNLGKSATFKAVVKDPNAPVVVYVDLSQLATAGDAPSKVAKALGALGLTASSTADGAHFDARLTLK